MAVDQTAKTAEIGKTGFMVPNLCFGTAPIGNMPGTYGQSVGEERARETVRAIFDSPIKFLDTSRNYGAGRSETRIGEVIRERGGPPEGLVISTKLDRNMQNNCFDADVAKHSFDQSLKALGVDRVQILHLHDPEYVDDLNDVTKSGGALDVLFDLKEQGLADAVGLAAGRVDIMMPILRERDFDALITHNRFMVTNRNAEEMIDLAQSRNISVLNAAPYAGGALAKGSKTATHYVYQEMTEAFLTPIRQVEAVCQKHDVPTGAVALQFSMRDPRVASTILGISRPERITQTLEWANWPVPEAIWDELDNLTVNYDDPEATREYSNKLMD